MANRLTYSELIQNASFEERFNYLKFGATVGEETFGVDRYLNQKFYNSPEWKRVRDRVIVRDCGRDLGCEGYDIFSKPIVHHLNPITKEDVINHTDALFDMENLITISEDTHRALHYGSYIPHESFKPRQPGDTKLW